MANKRKPNVVHKLNGTHRKDRHGAVRDIEYSSACPVAPKYLNALAIKEWNRIVPTLHEIGLVTDLDTMILAQYCSMTAEFEQKQNAGEEIAASWSNQFKLIQQELGMTPSSRSGLKLPDIKPKESGGVFAGGM